MFSATPSFSILYTICYQSLLPDSLILGVVKSVHDFELVISLPSGYTGTVPITNISDAYRQKIQALADEDKENEELSEVYSLHYM
jgi:hypothetical protein